MSDDNTLQQYNWLPEPGAPFEALMDVLSKEMTNPPLPPGGLRYLLTELNHREWERARMQIEIDSSGAMVDQFLEESESGQPYVAVKSILEELNTLFTYITLDAEIFPGKAYRYMTAVQCALVHVGLYHLEKMLVGRRTWREKMIEAGRKGQRLYTLEQPRWSVFHPMQTKQRNIYCYDRTDYARMEKIHDEYKWDMGFTIQMAVVVGIVHSELLPKELKDKAEEEVEALKKWIEQFNA